MEVASKRIILVGYAGAIVTYVSGFIVLFVYARIFRDYSTGFYWYSQLGLLAKEILGATIVPALLFELFFIARGLKRND